ncbi:hypothetical protein N431DRAFT_27375 [Stipitochalara longipes BDJ]|nr:hypothetical protein N431DRAFT_27375 [Stipitochalara longipes BDJ]
MDKYPLGDYLLEASQEEHEIMSNQESDTWVTKNSRRKYLPLLERKEQVPKTSRYAEGRYLYSSLVYIYL